MSDYFQKHQDQRRPLPCLLLASIWVLAFRHIYLHGIPYDNSLLAILMLALAMTLLLFRLKRSIGIDRNGLSYKMAPFHRTDSHIKLHEVIHTSVRVYHRVTTLQGWGRGIFLNGDEKSCTNNGFSGLEILLKNGKNILWPNQSQGNTRAAQEV